MQRLSFPEILAREIKKQQEAARAAAQQKGVYGNQNQKPTGPSGILC